RDAARNVYGVVVDRTTGDTVVDAEATQTRRDEIREERRTKSVPVSEWIASSRPRIAQQELAPEVREMYRDSMALSERFAGEFREFWSLPDDFVFAERDGR
ncbi:MAG TPA: acetone carboxylase subunit alpha, partial [Brevibacterium sp.]|nr:acetone carboxylase subunit alpha [Brevibacterium sp.]